MFYRNVKTGQIVQDEDALAVFLQQLFTDNDTTKDFLLTFAEWVFPDDNWTYLDLAREWLDVLTYPIHRKAFCEEFTEWFFEGEWTEVEEDEEEDEDARLLIIRP